jgi:hypothetical protein
MAASLLGSCSKARTDKRARGHRHEGRYARPAGVKPAHRLALRGPIAFHPLPPAFTGKLCWIWERLAVAAVQDGADFFVLLGDDVHMLDEAWQEDVEHCFVQVAERTGLPFGLACVALRDVSFEAFSTFPCLHRTHIEIFHGRLFPPELTNQHGDPFLFEIYRRWAASRFTDVARASRHEKAATVIWRDKLLAEAIESVARWLAERGIRCRRAPCIDLVVPTYRCDASALSAICSLDSAAASVHVLVIVDRPDAPNLHAIKALNSYAANHTVRVYVQPENMGASMARNTGLAQSFGEYALFLDDDVRREPDVLDA